MTGPGPVLAAADRTADGAAEVAADRAADGAGSVAGSYTSIVEVITYRPVRPVNTRRATAAWSGV